MDEKRKEELIGKMDEAREKHLDYVINNLVQFRLAQDGTWHDKMFFIFNDYFATGEGISRHLLIKYLDLTSEPMPEIIGTTMAAFEEFAKKSDERSKLRDRLLPQNRKTLYISIQDAMLEEFPASAYVCQMPDLIMNLTYFMNADPEDNMVSVINSWVMPRILNQIMEGGYGNFHYSSTYHVNYS